VNRGHRELCASDEWGEYIRDEVLPWAHIAAGLHADFLWDDWQSALAEHGLPDCRWTPCYDCGVCTDHALEHVVGSPVPPAGGSHGPPDCDGVPQHFGERGIQAQSARDGAGDLRNLQSVGQAVTEVIGETHGENLGLRFQAAEGARMNDAVAVPLKRRAHLMLRLGMKPAAALFGI